MARIKFLKLDESSPMFYAKKCFISRKKTVAKIKFLKLEESSPNIYARNFISNKGDDATPQSPRKARVLRSRVRGPSKYEVS